MLSALHMSHMLSAGAEGPSTSLRPSFLDRPASAQLLSPAWLATQLLNDQWGLVCSWGRHADMLAMYHRSLVHRTPLLARQAARPQQPITPASVNTHSSYDLNDSFIDTGVSTCLQQRHLQMQKICWRDVLVPVPGIIPVQAACIKAWQNWSMCICNVLLFALCYLSISKRFGHKGPAENVMHMLHLLLLVTSLAQT